MLGLVFICIIVFQNCSSSFNFNKGFETTSQQEASSTLQLAGLSGETLYTWIGTNWNSCSVQCGGGTQTRNVSCKNSSGEVVSENSCSQPKPATTQSCQTQSCTPYFWVQSGFSPCSKSCGGGIQTQTVTCSSDKGQSVAESFCAPSKPTTSQSCNVQNCYSPPNIKTIGRLGLVQFGYWGSAIDGVNTNPDGEYISELADRSNVVFVDGIDPMTKDFSVSRIKAKIAKAREKGLGVVLSVQGLFFQWGTVKVVPNADERFLSVWTQLGSLQSSVQAFYVYDEPYGHNNVNPPERQIHWSFVRDNLNLVASKLSAMAPGIPSVVVFGADEIGFTNFYTELIPKKISWIGFDCYRIEGERCSEAAVRNHFKMFSNVASMNGQKLVLVPDAFASVSPSDEDQYKTVSRLKLYKELSASSWLVSAVYPWLYQDHTTNSGQVLYWGAGSLPFVKDELKIFFDVLMDQAHCDSNLNLVYKNGSSWSKAPACAATCEAGQVTYRDADGAFYSHGGSCL